MGLTDHQVPWALWSIRFHGPSGGFKFHGPHARVWGPGTHLGGALGALGPIWGGASAPEAEGRHYGGRRPTKWGSGGGAPRNAEKQKSKKVFDPGPGSLLRSQYAKEDYTV